MTPEQLTDLRSLLTRSELLSHAHPDFDKYRRDATDYSGEPDAVLVAGSTADVQAAVRFCAQNNIPIIPRGAGTGLSGGCVPDKGGLVISTERLRRLDIDPASQTAVCGPGVLTKELQDTALPYGLTYPPDPASYLESTLGGNVAEGAGGLRCRRFGVTKDYVLGLEAVLPDGSILTTGRYIGERGYALGDIFVGSEGTLGIVTEIVFRLSPITGRGVTLLAAFDCPEDAARTVTAITRVGLIPTVLEFMDGDAAAVSNEYERQEALDKVGGLLLIETSDIDSSQQGESIGRLCRENRARYLRAEPDPTKAEDLWRVRRNLSKASKQIAKVRVSEDIAVPNSKFADLVAWVADLNRRSSLRINSFGHAGDGNLHVNFLSMTGSEADLAEIESGVRELMTETIRLGGTLTGEHGIGLAKKEFLGLEFDPPTLAAMRALKTLFDPANRCNPGKLF